MILVPKRDIEEEGVLIGIKGKEYEILEETKDGILIIDETGEKDLISEKYMLINYFKLNKEADIEIELIKEDILNLLNTLRGKENLLKKEEAIDLNSLLKDLKTFLKKIEE